MKTTILSILATVTFALSSTTMYARSWRINNDTMQDADFVSINAAMDSTKVQDGDTLYLDPGCVIGDAQKITKQVTVVGPGYFRIDQPHRFAYITGNIELWAAHTKLEGCIVNGITNIRADYITLERCHLGNIKWSGTNGRYAIIRQCYITNQIYGYKTNAYNSFATIENNIILYDGNGCIHEMHAPIIRNNYIRNTGSSQVQSYSSYVFYNINGGTITNNILMQTVSKNKNRIFYGVSSSAISKNYMSCTDSTYTAYPENLCFDGKGETDIFKMDGTNDQLYQLKDDNPAKIYAMGGGECGPFGGLYPYVINGLPKGYPYYTKVSVSPKAQDGKVNVSLQIKMQDE